MMVSCMKTRTGSMCGWPQLRLSLKDVWRSQGDRRFYTEVKEGLQPAGETLLTNEKASERWASDLRGRCRLRFRKEPTTTVPHRAQSLFFGLSAASVGSRSKHETKQRELRELSIAFLEGQLSIA